MPRWTLSQVYPRVCGGTYLGDTREGDAYGLSPRVRGNHDERPDEVGNLRSIPACAGEPRTFYLASIRLSVYPRVCGGTYWSHVCYPKGSGLSPRVRGNPLNRVLWSCRRRSIPACAGEPWPHQTKSATSTVYPRVCGGTFGDIEPELLEAGLSPRVRGNQEPARRLDLRLGSIPACAGEPGTAL